MDSHKILKLPNGILDHVKKFRSIQKINETVICIVMARTRLDTTGPGLKFCDILECLVESENSNRTIQSIRNGMFFTTKWHSSIWMLSYDKTSPIVLYRSRNLAMVHLTLEYISITNIHKLKIVQHRVASFISNNCSRYWTTLTYQLLKSDTKIWDYKSFMTS